MSQHEWFDEATDRLPGGGERGVETAAALLGILERRGMPSRVVPAGRAADLRNEISGRRSGGEVDAEFAEECLNELRFDFGDDLREVRSIIIAAVPRPETAAIFHYRGSILRLPVPPTYTHYRALTERWVAWIDTLLGAVGYRAVAAELPLKLLATRSGLASYGRNNITYIPGLGSYFQLVAAVSDLPPANDRWNEPEMLERCLRCRACERRCPTGAITDRFLIHADRCLVFHNERADGIPFPEWIRPSAHHTVIGCMECQSVCPENRQVRGWTGTTEEFSEEETALLLDGVAEADVPEATLAKLQRLDAVRFLSRLPRNLGAALANEAARRPRGPSSAA